MRDEDILDLSPLGNDFWGILYWDQMLLFLSAAAKPDTSIVFYIFKLWAKILFSEKHIATM